MPATRLLADRRASVAIEMALVLPILLLIVAGIAEVGRAALIALKAQHAATAVADLATRDETLSAATVAQLFDATSHILQPFDLARDGAVIVSSAGRTGNAAPTIYWQVKGGGALAEPSALGAAKSSPQLPTTMALHSDDTVIVAEVILRYRRWLIGFIPEFTIRRTAFYRPRFGNLRSLTP